MAGKGKFGKFVEDQARGALDSLSDTVSSVLPDNIFDLPSFKEATRAFKKSQIDESEGYSTGEFKYDNSELDAEQISTHSLDAGDDLQLINYDESGYGGALKDWYDGKIELENFAEHNNFGGMGSEYLPQTNYPLDPVSHIIRDLEFNYGMSKDEIIDYFEKNNALPEDFGPRNVESLSDEKLEDILMKGVFDVSVDPETGSVGVKMMEQTPEISMIKEAFRSGDPNNPIVKNIRGALADLADEEGLAEVTPEMIYGKPN